MSRTERVPHGLRPGLRIAMWSGPRNISTAMMRAWESHGDTAVVDEPLYAHYLVATGAAHPGRDDIIASQNSDYETVTGRLAGPIPDGNPIWYQKHMAQHILADDPLEWLAGVQSCFLVRRPEEVVASFTANRPDAAFWELGCEQQRRLFDEVCDRDGRAPPVLDAADVLKNPAGLLRALCERLGVTYTDRMLRWPPGRRATDGVWAKHWYRGVEASSGFAPWRPRHPELEDFQKRLAERARPAYEHLADYRLTPQTAK